MRELKLIRIMQKLSPAELKDFEKFIISPYFNKGRNLLPYYKVLKKFYPEFDSPSFTKEEIYLKLNKGAKFDKKANSLINKLNSDMQQMLDNFLAVSKLNSSAVLKKALVNDKHTEYGLYRHCITDLKTKLKPELLNDGFDENFFFLYQKILSLTAEAYIGIGRMKEFHETYKEFSIINIAYLLVFYFEDFTRRIDFTIGSNVKLQPAPFGEILKEYNFEQIIGVITSNNRFLGEIVNVYYYMYLCYNEIENYQLYKKFKNILYANLEKFRHSEKFNLITHLYTLCVISGRLGYGSRHEEQDEIIEIKIKHGLFGFRKNEIHHSDFDGIVTVLLRNKKIAEAELFIHKFSLWLPSELRERYRNMALVRLNFEKGFYRKTLQIISKLPDLVLNKISVIQFKVLSLFELKEYEAASTQLESFKKYLKNNKTISKDNGEHYYGFAMGVNILIDAINKENTDGLKIKLQKLFEQYPASFRKNWILNKAEELEKTLK